MQTYLNAKLRSFGRFFFTKKLELYDFYEIGILLHKLLLG